MACLVGVGDICMKFLGHFPSHTTVLFPDFKPNLLICIHRSAVVVAWPKLAKQNSTLSHPPAVAQLHVRL